MNLPLIVISHFYSINLLVLAKGACLVESKEKRVFPENNKFFFLSTEKQISLRNNHLTKRRSSKFFCNIETGKATAASTVILRLTQAFTLTLSLITHDRCLCTAKYLLIK
jgi:hypothetical protein